MLPALHLMLCRQLLLGLCATTVGEAMLATSTGCCTALPQQTSRLYCMASEMFLAACLTAASHVAQLPHEMQHCSVLPSSRAQPDTRWLSGTIPATLLQERTAILRLQAAGLPLDSSVDLPGLAVACHGYSGADLAALCRQAAMVALTEAASAFLSGGS